MFNERNEEDIKSLLEKGKIFYKFSKSKSEYANLTYEEFHKDYPEFSVIRAEGAHGLSFCDDISKLLLCCGYGDQITQVIIDKDSEYFPDIDEYLVKESEEYNAFGEYDTHVMQTGKNYSLSDPSVINALIQEATESSLCRFFNYTRDGRHIEEIYEKFGFKESARFVEDIKHTFNIYCKVHDERRRIDYPGNSELIKSIASKLILNYKDKDDLFSFEKAEADYELNKDKTVDRRFEKIDWFKDGMSMDTMFNDVAQFLSINHFSKEQTILIAKILTENNLYSPDKLNEILPKFSEKFSIELLSQIRHVINNNKLDFSQIKKLLDDKRTDNTLDKESLIDKLRNFKSDYDNDKKKPVHDFQKFAISGAYR